MSSTYIPAHHPPLAEIADDVTDVVQLSAEEGGRAMSSGETQARSVEAMNAELDDFMALSRGDRKDAACCRGLIGELRWRLAAMTAERDALLAKVVRLGSFRGRAKCLLETLNAYDGSRVPQSDANATFLLLRDMVAGLEEEGGGR